jgi:3-oxoacyl-[acyl-carrier protein] reductase
VVLEGSNAVIYGAGGAIGGAVACAFAREGATVHLAERRAAPLEALAAELRAAGRAATVTTLDVLDEEAVERRADGVVAGSGSLDVSLNVTSHGEVFGTSLAEIALEDFERPVRTATRSTFLTARAAARHMIRQRSAVILTFGGYGQPLRDFYLGGFQVGLSAVDALRRQLAAELGPYGIGVVTIQSVGIPETHDGDDDGTPPRLLQRAPTLADVGDVAVLPPPIRRRRSPRRRSTSPAGPRSTDADGDRGDGCRRRRARDRSSCGPLALPGGVAVRQMQGMDMGVATDLGSFVFFVGAWVSRMAAVMLPGAVAAVELTPLRRACRQRCRERVRSGFDFGLHCLGSSIGLMLLLLAVGARDPCTCHRGSRLRRHRFPTDAADLKRALARARRGEERTERNGD